VARTSRSLDASSRTLLTEVDVPNRDFVLLPGMYAQVRLQFPRVTPPLLLPATALVIRSNGPQVMVVERERGGTGATIHFRSVQIARDYGSTVELASGLADGQTVVLNPNTDLVEGTRVRIAGTPGSEPAQGVPATPR
jgi:multidrug efflux pump subunit AcrA (membrane-fusion protein)